MTPPSVRIQGLVVNFDTLSGENKKTLTPEDEMSLRRVSKDRTVRTRCSMSGPIVPGRVPRKDGCESLSKIHTTP